MALYKRGSVWWFSFTSPDGRRIQQSTGTKNAKAAQELYDKCKAESWRIAKLGERRRYTWQEAVVRYADEIKGKASLRDDLRALRWLDPFLRSKYLDEIGRDLVQTITSARQADNVRPATVNRTLAVLRSILRRAAFDWEWLDRAPKVRLLPEPKRRVRWLTREEADRLLAELPEHIAEMARFTLATGLRLRNVTHLEWTQIDVVRHVAWIHGDQTKNRRALGVPLNADALAVLQRQGGVHNRYVFAYNGRAPVKAPNARAWRNAIARAGLVDFRWHDLRHTWASWHAQAGTPLNVLQELGGWEIGAMVRRYAHLAPEHLAEHAGRIERDKSATVGAVGVA